ncbi:MAG: extracellular solute-binding protein [bacterium]
MRYLCLILLGLLLLFAACGENTPERTTLTWWQFWTSPDVKPTIEMLASDFEIEHPEVDITLGDLTWSDGHEKIVISLAAGKGPDVIELGSDWVCEFAAAGKLLDITDAVADLRDDLLMWEPATYEDRIYGVPWLLGTRVLFCNRELLSRAGYDEHFRPESWDDLLDAARRVNELDDDVFGFGSNSAERHRLYKKYLPFFWSAGGTVFNEDRTATQFDSEAGRQSLEFYLQLAQTGITETQARLDEYFAAGKLGFVISGDWLVRKISHAESGLNYCVALVPGPDIDTPGLSFAGGEYLVVNAATDGPEECVDLLRFLVQPEQDAWFCAVANSFTAANRNAVVPVDTSREDIAAVFREQLLLSRPSPTHPKWVYLEEAIEQGVEQALYGERTPASALAEIDRQCAEILRQ